MFRIAALITNVGALLALTLVSGCAPTFLLPAPTPTATLTPTPTPTHAPAPSWTPIPATVTFTPVPTRTPVPDNWAEGSAATATWTPVPGNPRWSWWSYEGVAFLLPVAWQTAHEEPPHGRLFRAAGGGEQPRLLVQVERVPADTGVSLYTENKLQEARSEFADFDVLTSGPFDVGGTGAQRVVYAATLPSDAGAVRDVRGTTFCLAHDGLAVALRFSVADRLYAEWAATFDRIAASLELPAPLNSD